MSAESAPTLSSFKAYDVRGRVPDELNPELVTKIGRAYATFLGGRRVAVGHDIRLSSPELSRSLIKGLNQAGVDALDIGQCGTEEVYFATFHQELDGGVMITASHNPSDYNGLKLVREGARPISSVTGLREIEQRVLRDDLGDSPGGGTAESIDLGQAYVEHLMSYVDAGSLKPLKIVVNAGNGGAGAVIDRLEPHLPFQFVKLLHEPDGRFPNGVPNPLLPENRQLTAAAVVREGADLGVAWDGDFDRCFLFDEQGRFIEGYYIVGLLAAQMLERNPGGKVVHDPRLVWNTVEVVQQAGGIPVQCKSGHAFIKEAMRCEDAVYGGEMSAHHYFREFSYCDSGMLPWMLIVEQIAASGSLLSELVEARVARFPTSGEINRRLPDAAAALERVREVYEPKASSVDETDGVSLEFDDWRFNLRLSNTEPLIRLNVESREDAELMRQKTAEVLELLDSLGSAA